MKETKTGGYTKELGGSVKYQGTKSRVKKPLTRNYTGEPNPSDCSRALKPKQGGKPE